MPLPFFFNGGPVSVETFSRSNYLVGKCPLWPFAPLGRFNHARVRQYAAS